MCENERGGGKGHTRIHADSALPFCFSNKRREQEGFFSNTKASSVELWPVIPAVIETLDYLRVAGTLFSKVTKLSFSSTPFTGTEKTKMMFFQDRICSTRCENLLLRSSLFRIIYIRKAVVFDRKIYQIKQNSSFTQRSI